VQKKCGQQKINMNMNISLRLFHLAATRTGTGTTESPTRATRADEIPVEEEWLHMNATPSMRHMEYHRDAVEDGPLSAD